MRSLKANQQEVFYRQYLGERDLIDENGFTTGEREALYGDLNSAWLCVSPNKGNYTVEQFGGLTDYDRTMTTADTNLAIDEETILWLDGADTSKAHNYIVKRRAPWKNSLQFAISEVKVSGSV